MKGKNTWVSHLRGEASRLKVKYNQLLKNPELLAQVRASYLEHKSKKRI